MKNPFKQYNITMKVSGIDDDGEVGASVTVKLEDIARDDIMRPDYGSSQISALVTVLVKQLEEWTE